MQTERPRTAKDAGAYAAEGIRGLAARLSTQSARRYGRMLQIIVGIFFLTFGYWIGRDHFRLVLFGARSEGKLVGYQAQRFTISHRGNNFRRHRLYGSH